MTLPLASTATTWPGTHGLDAATVNTPWPEKGAVKPICNRGPSRITDAVIDKAKEWQNRSLEPV